MLKQYRFPCLLALVFCLLVFCLLVFSPSWAGVQGTTAADQSPDRSVKRLSDPGFPASIRALKAHVTWIGNSFSGSKGGNYFPLTLDSIAVFGDGTVLTAGHYNENYPPSITIKDGKYIGSTRPASAGKSDNSGKGTFHLTAFMAAVDPYSTSHPVGFIGVTNNGSLPPNPCPVLPDATVTPADIFDTSHPLHWTHTFYRTFWGKVVSGLAFTKTEIWVSFGDFAGQDKPAANRRVAVYNRATRTITRELPIGNLDDMGFDKSGHLWAVTSSGAILKLNQQGKTLLTLAGVTVGKSVDFDSWGRLVVVTRDRAARNISLYDTATGRKVGVFGIPGGIYSPKNKSIGRAAAGAFEYPFCARCDPQGNLYVLDAGGSWPQNGSISKFAKLKSGKGWEPAPVWQVRGSLFADNVIPDPRNEGIFYNSNQRFSMDWKKDAALPGSGWKWASATINFDRYPDEARNKILPMSRSTRKVFYARDKSGTEFKYLVSGNMEFSRLGAEGEGDTGKPCALFVRRSSDQDGAPAAWPPGSVNGYLIWCDKNGDGKFQKEEYGNIQPNGVERTTGLDGLSHIDDAGGVWTFPEQGSTSRTGYYYPLVDIINGAPYYDANQRLSFTLPQTPGTKYVYSSLNESSGDLYLSTWNPAKEMHSVARYVDLLNVLKARQKAGVRIIDLSGKQPDWSVPVARSFRNAKDAAGNMLHYFGDTRDAGSISSVGDYLFIAEAREGAVRVHRASDGDLVGRLSCGTMLEGTTMDSLMAFNAYKLRSGEYLIVYGDFFHNKNVLYRWKPSMQQSQKQGDKGENDGDRTRDLRRHKPTL